MEESSNYYSTFIRCGNQYCSWPSVSLEKAQRNLTSMATRLVLTTKKEADVWIINPSDQKVFSRRITVKDAQSIMKNFSNSQSILI